MPETKRARDLRERSIKLNAKEQRLFDAVKHWGVKEWVWSADIQDQLGETATGTHGIHKRLGRLKDRMEAVNHEFVLQGFRGRGYRLWPRKEIQKGGSDGDKA